MKSYAVVAVPKVRRKLKKYLSYLSDQKKNRRRQIMYFQRHNYCLLYRIDGDKAIITDIFHGLEDFENHII